jgi:hypothetical protein
VASGEDHAVLAAARLDAVRDQHAVRNDLVLAREPPLGRGARLLGDGDSPVEALFEKAPDRCGEPHPAEVAARVMRADHRAVPQRERCDAGCRGHRLVQVQQIEIRVLEHAPHTEDRAGAEDDVRQRAVRRDDHRAADRDHLGRRVTVPADPRMEHARELTGRIVAHDQADLVSEVAERSRLKFRMLYHGAPEGPRKRDDDAHLHLRTESMRACTMHLCVLKESITSP